MAPPTFDFESPPDRSASDSIKWRRFAGRDVVPMWVADMDFMAPPPVLEALRRRIDHGVFGYAEPWPSLVEAVVEGVARDHGWRIDPDWLVWLPGVVSGFNIACRAVGRPGEAVLTATPVYPPFLCAPGNSDRVLRSVALVCRDDRWQWDWEALEAAAAPGAGPPQGGGDPLGGQRSVGAHTPEAGAPPRLLMLCHPHNPGGRVYSADELHHLADFARRHDLVVCSDEIHCGLVLEPGLAHIPFASLDDDAARRSITLMAPSKTWNIPALYCAFAVIPDPGLRGAFYHAMRGIVPHVNVLGLVATEAAYRDGGPWRDALLDVLRAHRDRVQEVVAASPGLSMAPVEATYLAWIDCRELMRERAIATPTAFFEAAGVGLSDGADFGLAGFVRLNFGCPRATLEKGLHRLRAAAAGEAAP
ncbi:MAG: aminotransferase class I/II-fold pyridoxal phosphate-dependent enzyme [Betaproteobacteria bacterium]|nr:aminotransferase class I/II-fold pyridoxal phosphate-dependent enzyme [Betaproteobacteria bacterium]